MSENMTTGAPEPEPLDDLDTPDGRRRAERHAETIAAAQSPADRTVPPVRPWKTLGDVKFRQVKRKKGEPKFRLADGTEIQWENATADQLKMRELWERTYSPDNWPDVTLNGSTPKRATSDPGCT